MDAYLNELDEFLLSKFDDGMVLPELDGFLAGVIVSPDFVTFSTWLPKIWGAGVPEFIDDTELQNCIDLIMRHYDNVLTSLDRPGDYEPILESGAQHDDALWELWVGGFSAAMKLSPRGWNRMRRSDDAGCKTALNGIEQLVAIADGRTNVDEAEESRRRSEAPSLIPIWVQILHEWRLENDPRRPPSAKNGKAGRNDPCPCGSGKKYKKCCGLN